MYITCSDLYYQPNKKVVSIAAFQVVDPGTTPGRRIVFFIFLDHC